MKPTRFLFSLALVTIALVFICLSLDNGVVMTLKRRENKNRNN